MTAAALPIVWVAVGGRSDLTTTLIGTILVLAGFQALTIHGSQYALVVMGALLVLTVLIAPRGLIFGLFSLITRRKRRTAADRECEPWLSSKHAISTNGSVACM